MSDTIETLANNKCFGGHQLRIKHWAQNTQCDMVFSIYLPPAAEQHPVPVLYWLSGLTCDDQNFVTKAGAQRYAAEHGIAIVAPDTSPRGKDVPDDPDEAYDFGLGAGFYVNATEAPWQTHYRMRDYIENELPALVNQHFPVVRERVALAGHSMGGHGALTIGLREPQRYTSISAFAPICAPPQCPWGVKALSRYLGDDRETWKAYDASALIQSATKVPLLIDQGTDDNFLQEQLKPELLQQAAESVGFPLQLRMQEGYDHSYFFISTFIGDHINFHAKHLSD